MDRPRQSGIRFSSRPEEQGRDPHDRLDGRPPAAPGQLGEDPAEARVLIDQTRNQQLRQGHTVEPVCRPEAAQGQIPGRRQLPLRDSLEPPRVEVRPTELGWDERQDRVQVVAEEAVPFQHP